MTIGHGNLIIKSLLVDSKVGNDNQIGPFTHMRGHTEIMNHARVGNFVEVKTSVLHDGVKAAHLSYLGNADIDEGANIGCGTSPPITTARTNGKPKSQARLRRIGTTIIAPLEIGDDAFIAAGRPSITT
jgi:bifunctional UDP-N-acetylglucosamine pyrophosphorylase/glucosamine-1-phosphate N-acetyltransferase